MNKPVRIATMTLTAIVATASMSSAARPIHYGAVSDAELGNCDRIHWQGRTDQSVPCYESILQSDAAAEIRAEAAWALRDPHGANRLFQAATARNPGNASILARWGDLYADTHQDAEAMNIYREALAADSTHAHALLGAARLLVGSFNDEANGYLEPLLDNTDLHEGARPAPGCC